MRHENQLKIIFYIIKRPDSLSHFYSKTAVMQFENNSSCLICGGSNSGKTFFVTQIIERLPQLFENPPQSVHYYYGVYQPLFDKLERDYGVIFQEGAPTLQEIDEICDGAPRCVILDDIMDQIVNNSDLCKLFTQYCHHKNLVTYFIMQNLFLPGKHSTTITRNADYFVFTRSPRNLVSITNLAKQVYPGNSKGVIEAYKDITQKPYGIMLWDLHAKTPIDESIFGNIFSDDPCIYLQNGYRPPSYFGPPGYATSSTSRDSKNIN